VYSGLVSAVRAVAVLITSCISVSEQSPHRIFQVMDYLGIRVYACAAHADTELNSVGNKWLFQLWFSDQLS